MHPDEHSDEPDDDEHQDRALAPTNADACVIPAFDGRAWHCPFGVAGRCQGFPTRPYVSLIALPGFS